MQPLVSFVILTFNQEKYIEEAIEGALSQTYQPLEIIISDDCSSDLTYEITRKIVYNYTGPHRVILNQNKENLGIGQHINKIIELSSGEFIVAAAGDDVSLPNRTSVLAEYLLKHQATYSVYSNMKRMDQYGNVGLLWVAANWRPYSFSENKINLESANVFGCSHAFRRCVFDVFGKLNPLVMHEDIAIPFRSSLLGDVNYIPEPLVLYRRHSNNASLNSSKYTTLIEFKQNRLKYIKNNIGITKTKISDLLIHQEIYKVSHQNRIKQLRSELTRIQLEKQIFLEKSIFKKIKLTIKLIAKANSFRILLKILISDWAPYLILLKWKIYK